MRKASPAARTWAWLLASWVAGTVAWGGDAHAARSEKRPARVEAPRAQPAKRERPGGADARSVQAGKADAKPARGKADESPGKTGPATAGVKALPPAREPSPAKDAPTVKDGREPGGRVRAGAPHGTTALRTSATNPSLRGSRKEAKPERGAPRGVKLPKVKPPCFRDPVTIVHFNEEDSFPLTKCDGSVAPLAQERLSVLARPGSAVKPKTDPAVLAQAPGEALSPGIRRVDPLLIQRIQTMIDHFAKARRVKQAKIHLVSGYRPSSKGSYHASGRALDLRLEGVTNEALVAFCKTLPDTGCGYYPNSSFIHVDVRKPGTGHVAWIDASGPGESPRYVSSWPPPPSQRALPAAAERAFASVEAALAKLDRALPVPTVDEHAADVARRPDEEDATSPLDLPAVESDDGARAAKTDRDDVDAAPSDG